MISLHGTNADCSSDMMSGKISFKRLASTTRLSANVHLRYRSPNSHDGKYYIFFFEEGRYEANVSAHSASAEAQQKGSEKRVQKQSFLFALPSRRRRRNPLRRTPRCSSPSSAEAREPRRYSSLVVLLPPSPLYSVAVERRSIRTSIDFFCWQRTLTCLYFSGSFFFCLLSVCYLAEHRQQFIFPTEASWTLLGPSLDVGLGIRACYVLVASN